MKSSAKGETFIKYITMTSLNHAYICHVVVELEVKSNGNIPGMCKLTSQEFVLLFL